MSLSSIAKLFSSGEDVQWFRAERKPELKKESTVRIAFRSLRIAIQQEVAPRTLRPHEFVHKRLLAYQTGRGSWRICAVIGGAFDNKVLLKPLDVSDRLIERRISGCRWWIVAQ
jgi:hypothetical protein